jgi:hypothetical protein
LRGGERNRRFRKHLAKVYDAAGGVAGPERFVMLLQKETFDYTKWQENLLEDMTIDEIYNNAAKLRNENTAPQ